MAVSVGDSEFPGHVGGEPAPGQLPGDQPHLLPARVPANLLLHLVPGLINNYNQITQIHKC